MDSDPSFLLPLELSPAVGPRRYLDAVSARSSISGHAAHLTGKANTPLHREVFANRIKSITAARAQLRRPDNCTVASFMPKYHRWNCRSAGGHPETGRKD